jgi:hypothetical protein
MITAPPTSSIPALSAAGRALTSFDVPHSKAGWDKNETRFSPWRSNFHGKTALALFVQKESRARTYAMDELPFLALFKKICEFEIGSGIIDLQEGLFYVRNWPTSLWGPQRRNKIYKNIQANIYRVGIYSTSRLNSESV